ncbi:MAG TPA: tRNA 2-selenouridine(34) synthase MnmH [Bacteroidia bacterium]|nr:tRNA 2-selenouridine(34) synthase MnmH [Bacteroidia bacterium]
MSKLINRTEFLEAIKEEDALLLDARSPKEYKHAHIPGAVNVPLLNDAQREKVGITYKKEGRDAAVLKGFELVGPHFADIIRHVRSLGEGKAIYVYCWRGGMRSGILAWLLSTAGFRVYRLEEGYKSYRALVLETLKVPRNIIILGGKTGSGKTELLAELSHLGEQIIDLEKLANHKGSSFGALGQEPQPSNEQFENLLFTCLENLKNDQVIWLENESRSIGSVKIPDSLFDQMRVAGVVEVDVPTEIRKQRILKEYGTFPKQILKECSARLEKRLGGLRMKLCLDALEENRMGEWLDYLLEYYDETYAYGMSLRELANRRTLSLSPDENYPAFAKRIRDIKVEFTQIVK